VKTGKVLEPGYYVVKQSMKKLEKDAGILLKSKGYYHIAMGNVNKMVDGSGNKSKVT